MQAARTALTREPPSLSFDVLQPLVSRIDLWGTVYYHVMAGPQAVIEWFRGTGLRPFLEALSLGDERLHCEQMLLDQYREIYPSRPSGHVLFPFRRVAYR